MDNPTLLFRKLSKNAFDPVKGSELAAGFDLKRCVFSSNLNWLRVLKLLMLLLLLFNVTVPMTMLCLHVARFLF